MIFLIDKPENPKNGYSYVVNRNEDKYTILEGDINLFDKIAFENINKGKSEPYDTIVLSFEEEELTLEEITEIYYEWKEMYLGSYDEDEYYLFSVIHWDDDHPHIHVGAIRHSMINEKELRMTRYGKDNKLFGRNDAIQEVINYKYGLKSPHGSMPLYPTTYQQKKRDWKVKKGSEWHEVEDDGIYDFMRMATVKANNFQEFWDLVCDKFEKCEIKQKHFEEVVINIDGKRFKSALFNEEFYNKNIDDIKNGIETFSGNRKNKDYYYELWNKKDYEHSNDLKKRNIHEDLLEFKIEKGELSFLSDFINIEKEFEDIQRLKGIDISQKEDEKFLIKKIKNLGSYLFSGEDIKLYLEYCGVSINKSFYNNATKKGVIEFIKDGIDITISDDRLYDSFKREKGCEEYYKLINESKKTKIKETIINIPLNKRDNIDLIRDLIKNEVIERNISSKKEFDLMINDYGFEKVNEGHSVSRGSYITLKKGNKKFALYDELIYSFYNEEIELEKSQINNGVLKSSLIDLKGGKKPESVREFKLEKSDDLDIMLLNQGGEDYDFTEIEVKRNRKAVVEYDDRTDAIFINKGLGVENVTNNMIEQIRNRDWHKVKLSGSDEEYQREMIRTLMRLSDSGYSNDTWLKNLKLDCDFYEKEIHIKDGIIYEIEEDNLITMMDKVETKVENESITGVSLKKVNKDINIVQAISEKQNYKRNLKI